MFARCNLSPVHSLSHCPECCHFGGPDISFFETKVWDVCALHSIGQFGQSKRWSRLRWLLNPKQRLRNFLKNHQTPRLETTIKNRLLIPIGWLCCPLHGTTEDLWMWPG